MEIAQRIAIATCFQYRNAFKKDPTHSLEESTFKGGIVLSSMVLQSQTNEKKKNPEFNWKCGSPLVFLT